MEEKKIRQRGPNNTPPSKDILRKASTELGYKDLSDIILYGRSSHGKTTTLQHLSVLLLSGGKLLNPNVVSSFETKFWNGKTYNDFMLLIPYKRDDDNKQCMIYISTRGDNWLLVEDNFEFFYQYFSRKENLIHIFDGTQFKKWKELSAEQKIIWLNDIPTIFISPANFNNGAIQAQRYYLDVTYTDWKRERWIKKERKKEPGSSLPEYRAGVIKQNHDEIAKEIIKIIHDFMDNTIV